MGDEFTNIRPIVGSSEFTNVRPINAQPQSSPIQDTHSLAPRPATPRPTASLSTGETIKRYSGMEALESLGNKALDSTKPIENYTQQGRAEHPLLSRVGDVTSGLKELLLGGQTAGKPMGTSSGVLNNPVTQAMSMAPEAASGAAAIEKGIRNPEQAVARLNKILGVTSKEIRVGELPSTLDEFAQNPARGVVKAGLKEKDLAKMNPLERMQVLTKVRNESGEALDKELMAHTDKVINVQKTVEDVFKKIDDRRLTKIATARFQRILSENKITKPLSQLTPMEARTIQRGLDEFANFAPEGTAKSFADIATALRRGISKATRQAIPETAQLDQDYGDLAGAVKASRRQSNQYARTVPVGKLRKMAPYLAGTAVGGGIVGGAIAKYLLPSQTP